MAKVDLADDSGSQSVECGSIPHSHAKMTTSNHVVPMDSSTFVAMEQCLHKLKLCVRLSPDGTLKPEGEVKMSREEFSMWVQKKVKAQ